MRTDLAGRRFVRLSLDGRPVIARVGDEHLEVLEGASLLDVLLAERAPTVVAAIRIVDWARLEPEPPYELLAPLTPPEVWAAGVTYLRSRDARIAESATQDVYARVYDAPMLRVRSCS